MATVLNEKHCYTQSSEDLFKIYITENLISQRYEGVTARNVQINQCEQSGDVYTVDSTREVEADIPKVLAKFAGKWNTIEQKETWTAKGDGIFNCNFTVKVVGVPVEMAGHMVVQPSGDGSANVIELTVNCGIPFIGKAAEKFVAGDSDKSMQKEHIWIKEFLHNNT
jgi:hypothetical protein